MFRKNPVVNERLQLLLDEMSELLEGVPVEERVPLALEAGSRMVEVAAFGLAQMSADFSVSRLILLAADLDRMGQGLTPRDEGFLETDETA